MPDATKPIIVEMDTLPGYRFRAFTAGGDWNGWAEPWFALDEGLRIVEAFKALGTNVAAHYNDQGDVFVFEDNSDDDGPEAFGGRLVAGRMLYAIGTAYWCWSEAHRHALQSRGQDGAAHRLL